MFGLYTKKQVAQEIEKAQFEDYQRHMIEERFERIEKRLHKLEFRLKHGTDKLKVGEPIPVTGDDCGPCHDEDFG